MNHLLSIPEFKVMVRAEYLYDLQQHHGEYVSGVVHSVKSMYGRALGFNVLLTSGACFWNLPVSAICWKECQSFPLDHLELWDCLADQVCCEVIGLLQYKRCTTKLKSGIHPATYRMTFDFASGPWAEMPDEHKCFHLLALDDGQFALQPNNTILWQDQNIVLDPKKPDYKVNTHIWVCEGSGSRVSDSDDFQYEVK